MLGLVTHREVRVFAADTPALREIAEENPGMTRSRMERQLRALAAPRSSRTDSETPRCSWPESAS